MNHPPTEYRCLARDRRFLPASAISESFSLWLGSDHLLLVSREAFTETYKRFFFKDIQAVVLLKTRLAAIYNTALAIVVFLLSVTAVLAAVNDWGVGAAALASVFALVSLIPLSVALLRGPACECYIHTSVQTERLYALSRLKAATEVVRTIGRAVEAVQGNLSPDEAARIWTERANRGEPGAAPGRTMTDVPKPSPAVPGVQRPLKYYSGWAHMALFSLMLADFVNSCSEWFIKGGLFGAFVAAVFLLTMAGFLIVALVKQHRSRVTKDLKITTWTAAAFYLTSVVLAFGRVFYLAVSSPETLDIGFQSPTSSLGALGLNIFSMTGAGSVGCIGWIETWRSRRQQKVPPTLPVAPPAPEVVSEPVDSRPVSAENEQSAAGSEK